MQLDPLHMTGASVYSVCQQLPKDDAMVVQLWWSMHDALAVECADVWSQPRSKHRLYKYGLKTADWFLMVAQQKSACAICKRAMHPLALNIDHDHGNGLVRGLLCTPCNTGLGTLGIDNGRAAVDRALEVLAYAKRSVPK